MDAAKGASAERVEEPKVVQRKADAGRPSALFFSDLLLLVLPDHHAVGVGECRHMRRCLRVLVVNVVVE